MSKFAVVLASAFLWSGALHAHDTDCCYEGTAEFETCRIHGEGDGHANDGASGGHAQPGVPHGEEVEETCYDEFNIEIDCNDLEVGHHGEGDGQTTDGVSGGDAQPGAPDGEEVEEWSYDGCILSTDCDDLEVGHHGEGDAQPGAPDGEEVECRVTSDEGVIQIVDCNGEYWFGSWGKGGWKCVEKGGTVRAWDLQQDGIRELSNPAWMCGDEYCNQEITILGKQYREEECYDIMPR